MESTLVPVAPVAPPTIVSLTISLTTLSPMTPLPLHSCNSISLNGHPYPGTSTTYPGAALAIEPYQTWGTHSYVCLDDPTPLATMYTLPNLLPPQDSASIPRGVTSCYCLHYLSHLGVLSDKPIKEPINRKDDTVKLMTSIWSSASDMTHDKATWVDATWIDLEAYTLSGLPRLIALLTPLRIRGDPHQQIALQMSRFTDETTLIHHSTRSHDEIFFGPRV
ncbi:hypothetical protein ACLOJK_010838 [Asimina triloba]